ncbi:hypothetical protein ACRAWF_16060 [Streptomyces sp. L7]
MSQQATNFVDNTPGVYTCRATAPTRAHWVDLGPPGPRATWHRPCRGFLDVPGRLASAVLARVLECDIGLVGYALLAM